MNLNKEAALVRVEVKMASSSHANTSPANIIMSVQEYFDFINPCIVGSLTIPRASIKRE